MGACSKLFETAPPRQTTLGWSDEEFAAYQKFRTGFTFSDIRQMLWSYSDDPADWGHVTRRTVLGYWRQLKLEMWHNYKCGGGYIEAAEQVKISA
jgi:hypothetical protein